MKCFSYKFHLGIRDSYSWLSFCQEGFLISNITHEVLDGPDAWLITESKSGWDWKKSLVMLIWSNFLIKAGYPKPHGKGLYPNSSWISSAKETPQPLQARDNSKSLNFYIPASLYQIFFCYFFTLLQMLMEYFHFFYCLNQPFLTIEVVGQEHFWNEHTPVNIVGWLRQSYKHSAKLEALYDFWREDIFRYSE